MRPKIRNHETGEVREMTWEEYFAWLMYPTVNIVKHKEAKREPERA